MFYTKGQVLNDYEEKKKNLDEEFKRKKEEYLNNLILLKEEKEDNLRNLPSEVDKRKRKEIQTEVLASRRKRLNLPSYTFKEELMNAISHIVGGAICLAFLIVGIYFCVLNHNEVKFLLPMVIYGCAMIFLYTMSSLYHFLGVSRAKKVFQYLDHCTVFVLIAGTYVPVCSFMLDNIYPYNFAILGVVLGLSALGISLNATMMDKLPVKIVSNTLYLVIGWLIILFYKDLYNSIGLNSFITFVCGGVAYTIGAILYGVGSRKRYFHFIFHLFCIAGTVLQFVPILLYLM